MVLSKAIQSLQSIRQQQMFPMAQKIGCLSMQPFGRVVRFDLMPRAPETMEQVASYVTGHFTPKKMLHIKQLPHPPTLIIIHPDFEESKRSGNRIKKKHQWSSLWRLHLVIWTPNGPVRSFVQLELQRFCLCFWTRLLSIREVHSLQVWISSSQYFFSKWCTTYISNRSASYSEDNNDFGDIFHFEKARFFF